MNLALVINWFKTSTGLSLCILIFLFPSEAKSLVRYLLWNSAQLIFGKHPQCIKIISLRIGDSYFKLQICSTLVDIKDNRSYFSIKDVCSPRRYKRRDKMKQGANSTWGKNCKNHSTTVHRIKRIDRKIKYNNNGGDRRRSHSDFHLSALSLNLLLIALHVTHVMLKLLFLQISLHLFASLIYYLSALSLVCWLIDNVSRSEGRRRDVPASRLQSHWRAAYSQAVACSKLCIDDLRQTAPRVLNEPRLCGFY